MAMYEEEEEILLRILYFLSSFSFYLFAAFVFNTLPSYIAQASLKPPNLLAQLPIGITAVTRLRICSFKSGYLELEG